MTPPIDIDGEIDASWKSYWPPDVDEESGGTDEAATDTGDTTMSEADDTHHDYDDELPIYATDPEQGEITTVGEPETPLKRELQQIIGELKQAGRADVLSDLQKYALAVYRSNPSKTTHEVASSRDFSQGTIDLARRRHRAATAETEEEVHSTFNSLSGTGQRIITCAVFNPDAPTRDIAEMAGHSTSTVREYVGGMPSLVEKLRAYNLPDSAPFHVVDGLTRDNGPSSTDSHGGQVTGEKTGDEVVYISDGERYVCDECGEAFETRNQRNGHLSTHNPKHPSNKSAGSGADVSGGEEGGTDASADDENKKVDVAFKLGRDVYHILDDDGEVYCNYSHANHGTDAGLIRTVESDIADQLDRCKQCAQAGYSSLELSYAIHEALETGREASSFNKGEKIKILEGLESADEW